jgi:outer membrane protein assembly factor BamB/mono/diheme cytochrome c family protein
VKEKRSFHTLLALAAVVAAVVVGIVVAGCGGDSGTNDETSALGETGDEAQGGSIKTWSNPNGGIYNHRNANSEIEESNLEELGVSWTLPISASLDNTFVPAAKFGYFASTPVFGPEGTVYFQDAANNVFAVNSETGEEIWKKEYNLPNEGPNGVTLVDGVIYGATSTFGFALDAETGKELWRSPRLVIDEKEGEAQFPAAEKVGASTDTSIGISAAGQGINFAPQVADGKVYLSTSGQITGGEAVALDAKTGEILWKTNEVKEPADRVVGGIAGTGGSWNAPAISPSGLVYFGIGNPYRTDTQAIDHASELLYNDSTIALDPESGKVKWYYQGVPNDFYDWDMQISPVYVESNDEPTILDAGKMGYVYSMNAETGKLNWKTPVGTHNGHDEDGKKALEGKYHPTKYPYTVYPGTLGGVETNMAVAEDVAYVVTVNSYQERPDPNTTLGGGQSLEKSDGDMAAIDIETGKVIWETKMPGVPFGATTVSNDLVFTTLYDGTVLAVNRESGEIVWEEKLPGGTNAPLVIQGNKLIAVNSVPTGSKKPTIVAWELGATGTVEAGGSANQPGNPEAEKGGEEAEAKEAEEAEAKEKAAEEKAAKEKEAEEAKGKEEGGSEGGAASAAMLTEGKSDFTTNCSSCHTLSEAGTSGAVGPNLDELMPNMALVVKQVTNGGGGMPAFGGVLSKQEIEAIAAYVSTVAGTGNDTLGGASTGGGGGP